MNPKFLSEAEERYSLISQATGDLKVVLDRLIASAADVPVLVKTLRLVLEMHWPEETDWGTVCGGCWAKYGRPSWPCATVDCVAAELAAATEGGVR